uniref:Slc25a-25 n=1 Tax=Schmidtea mediterranea TaxID=79327 RepID=A0A0H3YKB9_SCHMD|nr:slc25a-25 [Schmidtea mediterranea]
MSIVDETSKSDSLSLLFPQIFNPLKYAKVLIQLGYEPISPFMGHNLFSIFNVTNKTWRYPWIGNYIYYMYQKRGITHVLTAGLFARLSFTTLSGVSQRIITQRICENTTEDEIEDVMEKNSWGDFYVILVEISVFKLYEVIITHPFKVIMTRQMADFIVDENDHAWFIQAVLCIIKESGWKGFYKGIVPSIFAELCRCAIYYGSCRLVYNMLKSPSQLRTPEGEIDRMAKRNETVKLLCRSVLKYAFSNVFYPFEVVSTVMMLDGVNLNKHIQLSDFKSWRKCWRTLKLENQLYRGYSFIFRNHVKFSGSV